MKKLSKRSFRGIDYILLDSLSPEQAESLKKTLDSKSLIKILMYDKLVENCVIYSAYETWLTTYIEEPKAKPAKVLKESISLS